MQRDLNRRQRQGIATIEAAVLLPVLVLLAFGFVEAGYYVNGHHVLQDAARQGARAAVRTENSNAQVTAAVVQSLSNSMDVDPAAVTVTIHKLNSAGAAEYQVTNLNDNEEGAALRVTVTLNYSNFRPPSNFLGISGGSLSSSAVMQRQD